jgi:hypothetical protein
MDRLKNTMYNDAPTTPAGLEMGALRMASGNSEEKKNSFISQAPDSVANDIYIEKYLPYRVAQLALANYMRIRITIPGDPLITAGSTVNFSTYTIDPVSWSQGGGNASRPVDPFYSGKYLVTAVRHIVKNNGYITVVELAKESVNTPYAGTNQTLQSYVNGVQI